MEYCINKVINMLIIEHNINKTYDGEIVPCFIIIPQAPNTDNNGNTNEIICVFLNLNNKKFITAKRQ